jgi:LacI family transcriptional regulator
MRQRLDGYRQALKEADIAHDPALVMQAGSFESALTGDSAEFWPDKVGEMLSGPKRPTAIFAPIDILAIKVMHAAAAIGLRVPDDVAVAGFDDILMSAYTTPALTTVRHPSAQVGRIAALRLFEQLGDGEKTVPACERVPCELVIRESCGARR